MSTPAKNLSALLQRSDIDDHDEILKASNAALKESKHDIAHQHVKFVALLKLDRFDDALRVLEEGGDKLKTRAGVERAYALYKVGELDEAKNIAKSIAEDRGARHVEAQAVRIFSVWKGNVGTSSLWMVGVSIRGLRKCCEHLQVFSQ